jgi:prepilin-type N-terminal cleavage/methylation domain-containing protein
MPFSIKNSNSPLNKNKKGFTLIELLIVIAILAVLMSVIVITINPAEMLKKSRDSRRVSDLDALRTALILYLSENLNGFPSAAASYAYISVPQATAGTTTAPYCGGTGKSCYATTTANYKNIDGTGWIPLNFKGLTFAAPLSALPTDPTNSTSSSLYYIFCASSSLTSFELNANFESSAYQALRGTDGGNTNSWYEIGSDLYILN